MNASIGKKIEHYTAVVIGRCCENFFLCDTHKTKDTSFSSTLGDDNVVMLMDHVYLHSQYHVLSFFQNCYLRTQNVTLVFF